MAEFQGRRIRAVVFDVFGTLAFINDKRRPYHKLLALSEQRGRTRQPDDGTIAMSMNCSMAGFADWLGTPITLAELSALEMDLYAELPSIRLYPEARDVLLALKSRGVRIALCSNLAAPYAVPIKTLLPFELDAYAWSFEVGAVKPSPRIYQHVCSALQLLPEEILMVGDTHDADCIGPRAFGMNALPLARNGVSQERLFVRSLDGVLRFIDLSV